MMNKVLDSKYTKSYILSRLNKAKKILVIDQKNDDSYICVRTEEKVICRQDTELEGCQCYPNGYNDKPILLYCWRPLRRVRMMGQKITGPHNDPSFEDYCSACLADSVISTGGTITILEE